MIELVFIACLQTLPTECEERSMAHLPEVGHMGCLMTAQPQLALWSEAHPHFTITRWSCRDVRDRDIRA
jgi:hypothetical protein